MYIHGGGERERERETGDGLGETGEEGTGSLMSSS